MTNKLKVEIIILMNRGKFPRLYVQRISREGVKDGFTFAQYASPL